MALWEVTTAGSNDFTMMVYTNNEDVASGIFRPNGLPKNWQTRPSIQPFVDKKRKKQKPQADISHLTHGTMILNQRAYQVLADFLQRYGELLALDCQGELKYYYNVTNLVSCVDFEASTKIEDCVTKPVFCEQKIPAGAHIFKDPLTVGTRIYLTDEAKALLEEMIADAGLTGLIFFKAGEHWR